MIDALKYLNSSHIEEGEDLAVHSQVTSPK